MKARSSTAEMPLKPPDLNTEEDGGIPGVGVKSVDIRRNTSGEGGRLVWKLTLRRESVGSKQD